MSTRRLEYPLLHGYIQNWLVAGPQAIPVPDRDRLSGEDLLQVARHYYEAGPGIVEMPVDRASFEVGDGRLAWRYHRCLDDHQVDLSAFYSTCYYLRSWAYAQIKSDATQTASVKLSTHGPADLWVNGQHVGRQEHRCHQHPCTVAYEVSLKEGENEVLVRCEQVAVGACSYAMALRIAIPGQGGPGDQLSVRLPTSIRRVGRRQRMEELFEQAYLEGSVNCQGKQIVLHWADDLTTRSNYTCQVQDARGIIYLEASPETGPAETLDIGHSFGRLWERPYDVVLRARPLDYYEHDLRYERRLPIHVLDNPYSDALYGTFAQRRTEALEHAAKRGQDVHAEIAKMALGQWDDVDYDRVAETIELVRQRGHGSDLYLAGLLSIMYRYPDAPGFPQDLKRALQECTLSYMYWHDEPGRGAMCYEAERHSILLHTCEILAGQLYPDRTFSNAGQSGQWHLEKGERLALDWLHKRGTRGFSEWDSNCSFEQDLAALSLLTDFCRNERVWGLAAVIMDKMLLTIALNSFKGVFGSTHGMTCASMIRSGQLEATSGITRLLWGQGVWNHHAMGVVNLACSEYEMPLIVADIAVNLTQEMWNREHHPGVNKVTYRTPDYMLCSAQDYRPGERGSQEHVWQATMGPDAVVFVNHPACTSESDARQPNFWRGNGVLPRVAQWKDVLVAVHKLPDAERDWLGFTHAHFPVFAFDEHRLLDGWAFARKGKGYLALTASQGVELIERGDNAYRELRSYGQDNAWLCLMGREETDGSFDDFRTSVLRCKVEAQELGVQITTLRGDAVSFGWEEPLVVNGEEWALSDFKHYENPFCTVDLPAAEMEVCTHDYRMKLHFAPLEGDVEA